ncbi:hypothetical protein RN001_012798 [Aquatica leii]|uniref:RGS domain-containing protein n=1 Tax=Aquatica leii TaxID=1421715 RepID=A0AAN7S7X6_9COLE|nr:hypothetical protein RN001_012798 [Aquatica leii]
MLRFWKKSSIKQHSHSGSSSPVDAAPSSNASFMNVNGAQSIDLCPLGSLDDEGLFDLCDTEMDKQRSRLSKTLDEVLEDKSALGYFAQYLESRNALSYLHCWMDIEQFKFELQKLSNGTCISPVLSGKAEHDSLSVSTDCDSYTADSNSLCDCSYDIKVTETKYDKNTCDKSNDTSHSVISCSNYSDDCNRNTDKCCRSPVRNKALQRVIDDAFRIYKTYIIPEANENIGFTNEPEITENIHEPSKLLQLNLFQPVKNHIHDVLEKEYFHNFLVSDYYCKHQIDVLTSGNVALDDILYNETALFYFMEFLEQENGRNLLEFWIAASNFQLQLHEHKEFFDPIEAQSDAVVLYDKYFSLQAHCPLGFGDKIRFAVEQSICGEDGVMLDCFHLPLKIVEQVLERNYLKPFVASQLFYKYLSELISSVHNNFNSSEHKYSPSDCSSEKSFCTSSTFLAMEVPKSIRRKEKGADMNIDSRQLYDPDSLWKRKRNNRLSLGRISALGKYEPDFEPEPDKSVTSKLKIAMKKFVNLEEDSKKEEMAWKVAEMIVKDITNITLHDQKGFQS